jgi:membrane-associated protease RseP (regulator of RpoE activity)
MRYFIYPNYTELYALEEQGKKRVWVERKFILILIHTPFGLDFFDKLANTKAGRVYARFNVYLMPVITAGAIFLIVSSLIFLSSNSAVRAGARDLGPQANLLIPGLNPYLPWTYGWLALVVTVIIHEAGHGIVARVYNIKVESTGLLLVLGLPIGAFVNISPDELSRSTLKQKSAILTAGPLNNMITAALSLVALYFIVSTLTPIPTNSAPQYGLIVLGVGDHSLAGSIGLSKGSIIQTVAGEKIQNIEDLGKFLRSNLGNTVAIKWKDNTGHEVTRFANLPKHVQANQGILGISIGAVPDPVQALQIYKNAFGIRSSHQILLFPPTIGAGESVPFSNLMAPKYHSNLLGSAFAPVANIFYWLMFVSFNVAIFNALPIGPLDGGQLYNSLMESRLRSKPDKLKNASRIVTYVMVAVVAVSVLVPYLPV